MYILEEPCLSAGIEAWDEWIETLEALPARDESVIFAKKSALRTIKIMKKYPNGLNLSVL